MILFINIIVRTKPFREELLPIMNTENRIRPIDVGSFPLDADLTQYLRGAFEVECSGGSVGTEDANYFISKHNSTFESKAKALGPDVAVTAYAQCRGMIDQFLLPVVRHVTGSTHQQTSIHSSFGDITKEDAQAVAVAIATGNKLPSGDDFRFAEIIALQIGAENLSKRLGVKRISYKACITGPLELSLNLQRLAGFPRTYDEKIVEYFTEVVKEFVSDSIVPSNYLAPVVVTMDEPAFGLEGFGDFFTDTSSDPHSEHLISCWNEIYKKVPSDCFRGIHLHASPFENSFNANWNLLEAHVGVYVKRQWLEDYDKFIRAAIVRTEGPTIDPNDDAKDAWQDILSGNYERYLQTKSEMERHLQENINRYGIERVPFAGPECGFGPWDWKHGVNMATATLVRMNQVIDENLIPNPH
jgi:methionine synthase II (cobalamin-independent)